MKISDTFHALLSILSEMAPYILLGYFIAGLLHEFVSQTSLSRHLSGKGWGPVIKAALFGIPLPLCSCGVLPTAVSLRRSGASKGATTSFLIATPQTGVDSIAATWSLLGPAFAILRPIAALVGAVFGGMVGEKFSGEDSARSCEGECENASAKPRTFLDKCLGSLKYGFVNMIADTGKWLVIGLVVAALITVFVPDELFLGLSRYPILSMLLMTVIAIPMYICATGSIPIAMSLMLKGLSPGTAFVLLMAGPAANFASVMVLKKSMGGKATAIYIASVVVTAITFGLAIDYLLPMAWFTSHLHVASPECCHVSLSTFSLICSGALVILLFNAMIFNRKEHHHHIEETSSAKVYKIGGMSCPHCAARIKQGLEELAGEGNVEVDLGSAQASVPSSVAAKKVIAKVKALGYECSEA